MFRKRIIGQDIGLVLEMKQMTSSTLLWFALYEDLPQLIISTMLLTRKGEHYEYNPMQQYQLIAGLNYMI